MTFTTGATLSRCSTSGGHYEIAVTIAGVTSTLRVTLDEFNQDRPATVLEAREAILDRLRSAKKEAGATTFAQVRTALENKVFQV